MTLEQLRRSTVPLTEQLETLARAAEAEEFAPWVISALEQAARFASLSDDALRQARIDLRLPA